jgi:hypothetical protein
VTAHAFSKRVWAGRRAAAADETVSGMKGTEGELALACLWLGSKGLGTAAGPGAAIDGLVRR